MITKEQNINSQFTGVTSYYQELAESLNSNALKKQYSPSGNENIILDYETQDPLCEKKYSVSSRIIHRYPDRILFLATDRCAMYCRHCFRRYLSKEMPGDADENDINILISYLEKNKNIKEVLISGGDPLMLKESFLDFLLQSIRAINRSIIIRIGTRIPVTDPVKINNKLIQILVKYKPLFIFTQFNHYSEVTLQSSEAISKFTNSGIPVFNQTVLLKGINDSEEVLKNLFYSLVSISVKPYYLFQGDIAAGTSHFRTNLFTGITIMESLKKTMSSLTLPKLAVDLPGGGGKIELTRESVKGKEDRFFLLEGYDSKLYKYPDE